MPTNHNSPRFTPIVIAVSLVGGILIGTFLTTRFATNRLSIINSSSNKINDLLHIIDDRYVDTIGIAQVVERALPTLLSELDPHSSYIPAEEAEEANQELRGSFSGIGVQFTVNNDTVYISNVIHAGPAEKSGVIAGDRIIAINGNPYVGDSVSNKETMKRLRGEKGTDVSITVLRGGEEHGITITRDDIPVSTIDAAYMLTPQLGYIRVSSFGETTYVELLNALLSLQVEGFKGLVIDLRDNGGGYLGAAVQMINEFLPDHKLIVYTEGRKSKRQEYHTDGRGSYQSLPLIILTNEYTASAAEIFAGAIQDNDRGIIVGRRTFGKGLVQEAIDFPDGSLIHLTIARYYTPSGRCIQKPYEQGRGEEYQMEILNRYQHGEYFHSDSIHQQGEAFSTSIGRTVYGGGGIMPDYFVPEDTSLVTPWFTDCIRLGYLTEFCFNYTDQHRAALYPHNTVERLLRHLKTQGITQQFIQFCDQKNMRRRNNQILKSQPLIEQTLYARIIYNMLDMEAYLQYTNQQDSTVLRAIQLYQQGSTRPQLPPSVPGDSID